MYVWVPVSTQALTQSTPDVEVQIRRNLAMASALKFDQWGINGTGVGAIPRGILNLAGDEAILSYAPVAPGANGDPASWNWVTKMWAEVAASNALMGTPRWLMGARLAAKLMSTEKAANTANFIMNEISGNVMSYPVSISNQIPEGGTKGTGGQLAHCIFGDISQVLMASWGQVNISVDPYSFSPHGYVAVGLERFVDVSILQNKALVYSQDLITR